MIQTATGPSDGPIDKSAARRSFERAAVSYDHAALLQREIATRLLERLAYFRLQPRRVLDLGCGTGGALPALRARYPAAQLIGLDFALSMLARARPRAAPPAHLLCADLDALPLAAGTCELIFASAALQWSNDLARCCAALRRALAPGGVLLFATFGPDTLRELRDAWAAVDDAAHVNPFWDLHDLGDVLLRAGFVDPVVDVERLMLTYPSLRALMADLKAIGAHNPLRVRRRTLTGRQRFAALERAYEPLRRDGRLPSTWEVVYGTGWAGADVALASSAPSGQTQIPLPLGVRRRDEAE